MNPQSTYIPGQENTDAILQASAQMGANQGQQQFNNLSNHNTGNILSNINQSSQPQQEQPQQEDKGNWLTRLIPTAGSILGGLGGTLLDPFTAGLGTFGGAAAGGAAGKGLEDLIEGKSTNGSDIVGAGAEGLIGGGVGKLGEGALSLAGNALAKTGEKGIAKAAETGAAQNALDTAQATRTAFGSVKPAVLKANNLADTQELAGKVGADINSPQSFVDTSNHANDILNEIVNNTLKESGPVDASNLNDIFRESIGKNAGLLGGTDPVALARGRMGLPNTPGAQLYKQLQDVGAGIINNPNADPVAMRSMIGTVGKLAADAKPMVGSNGVIDPVAKAQYNTLNDIYNQLKNTLYQRPGMGDKLTSLTGGLEAGDVGGNEALANHLNDTINNAKNPQDILDQISNFTKMNTLGKAGLAEAQNPASAAALGAAKREAGIGSPTVDAQGNVIPEAMIATKHPIISTLGKVANFAGGGGMGSEGAVKLGSTLSRMAPLAGLAGGEVLAGAPNQEAGASAGTTIGTGMHPAEVGSTGNAMGDILNSKSPNMLPLQQILEAEKYGGSLNTPNIMSTFAPMAAGSLQQLNKVNSAQSQLSQLIGLENQAGGAQGPIGGLLSKLGAGFTGGAAAHTDQQAQQLTDEINQLTGSHIAAPSIMMDQQTANGILSQLQHVLGSYGGAGGSSSL